MKEQNGFTLIEILTALAILGIIIIALNNSLLSGVSTYNFNQERIDFQQNHRVINSRIAPYTRIASKIDVNPSPPPDDNHVLRLYFNERTTGSDNYTGIAFSLDEGNLRYSRYKLDPSTGNYDWGNNMTFISEKVTSVKTSFTNNVLNIEITLESDRGTQYTFTENYYSRYEDEVELLND